MFVKLKDQVIITVHVDDFLVSGPPKIVDDLLDALKKAKIKIREEGRLRAEGDSFKCLGRCVIQTSEGYATSGKEALVEKLVKDLGVEAAKAVDTPCVRLAAEDLELAKELLPEEEWKIVRGQIGVVLYLSHDRIDIQFAAKQLARDLSKPSTLTVKRLKRVAKYLKTYPKMWMYFDALTGRCHVKVVVDGDWGGDADDRASTAGGLVCLNDVLVSSWARTQKAKALSTAESEYYAIAMGVTEGMYVQQLLQELEIEADLQVFTDSSAAKAFAERLGNTRMRHIALKELFVKQMAKDGLISLQKIRGEVNGADMLTKPLTRQRLELCLSQVQSIRFTHPSARVSP